MARRTSRRSDYRFLSDFQSRFLPDARDIEVYLPEAYINDPARRFPVFYLHDGQNLFDGRTSYIPDHTWQAHTTADRLTRDGPHRTRHPRRHQQHRPSPHGRVHAHPRPAAFAAATATSTAVSSSKS